MPPKARLWLLVVCVFAVATAWAVDPPDEETDVLEITRLAFMAAETDEARLGVVKTFLVEHPTHPEVGMVIDAGATVLKDSMNDRDGAIALVAGHLPKVEDEDTRDFIRSTLVGLYSAPGYGKKLGGILDDLYDPDAMTYSDHLDVVRAYAAAEVWDAIDAHAASAAPLATPEAFRAAYPDEDFTDEYIQEAGDNRVGLLDTYSGWAAANRGDFAGAFNKFESAADKLRKTFFGLPEDDLYSFWGQTQIMAGQMDDGLDKLALASIYGHDEKAGELARKVYGQHGGDTDFDDYLWQLRLKHAPQMTNFTTNDYQDASRTYDELRGEKATLLAFWFPT